MWRRWALGLLVAGTVAASAIVVVTPISSAPDPCAGFDFCDEFNDASIDTAKWTVLNTHADLDNSEPGCYTPANVTETGGNLVELVERRTFTCGDTTGSSDYALGNVQMKSYSFTNGTVDVRAKWAGCQGCWPSVWMLGTNCQSPAYLVNGHNPGTCVWPQAGSQEVDIAEFLASDFTRAWQNVFTSGGTTSHSGDVGADASADFHVYTMVRSAGSLVFKIDGTVTNTYTSNLPSGPMFVIFEASIGQSGGTIDDGTLPATTQIDYIHVTEG